MRPNDRLAARRGFSLLEIMFAFIIVGVSILPMIGFITDKYKETPVIESQRYAQERGYDIMWRLMQEVPFEMLKASPGTEQPGSIVAQTTPSMANWNGTFAQTLLTSIFPGSTLLCTTTLTDKRNISYSVIVEVFDMSDPTPTTFSGTQWTDPGTWNEIYFDYYRLPEFYNDPNWWVGSNSNALPPSTWKTPYQYYGSTVGRAWGPADRLSSGSATFKKSDLEGGFPRDQKDRGKAWADWGNIYCEMKKLRLTIKWNLGKAYWNDPTNTAGRPLKIKLVSFKANISPSTVH